MRGDGVVWFPSRFRVNSEVFFPLRVKPVTHKTKNVYNIPSDESGSGGGVGTEWNRSTMFRVSVLLRLY